MPDQASPYLSRSFILGSMLIGLTGFGYLPIASSFYYGGGWPFVQMIFLAIYIVGVRQIRKSAVPRWVKLLIYLAPIVWWTLSQWESLTLT